MAKTYQIEFYYRGDVIDTKDFDAAPHVPSIGEQIYLSCENENNNVDGPYYKIIDKATLFFTGNHPTQKVQLKLQKIDKPDW